MKRYYLKLFILISVLTGTLDVFAQTHGSIAGIIADKKLNEPLTGATIQIEGSQRGTVADLDGVYQIDDLTPGSYTVTIKYISYKTVTSQVTVEANRKTLLNVDMVDESQALEGVVVMAFVKQNTEVALLSNVKKSLLVQSGISAQQISKTQDSDASAVIRRIPGISLIDNKFVMVRGLSQRYNNVWINNSGVPSSEADARAFSFDIIPSSQLDNMMVVKSPAPELPSDFSGGFIQIQTKDVPEKNSLQISVGGAVNDQTHFRNSYKSTSSPTDFLGFDSGMRGGLSYSETDRLDNSDSKAVTEFTKNALNNDWGVKKFTPASDLKLGATYNYSHSYDGGQKLALLSAVNYSNSSKTYSDMKNARYGIYNVTSDRPEYLYDYTDQRYDQNVRLGGMVNLTYIPRNGDKYEFKNIVNQLGSDRYTTRTGVQNISGYYKQEKTEYYYTSRTTYSGQFTGTHSRDKQKLDWSIGYAFANKNQPDRRIINREENGFPEDAHYGEMQVDQNEIQREFSMLKEHIASASANYKKEFSLLGIRPSVKTGAYGEFRTRDFRSRSLYYRWNENNLPSDFSYGNVVNEILTSENFGSDKMYLYEDTDNRNSYSGDNMLGAAYLGLFFPINKLEIYGGARYEYNQMKLKSYTSIKGTKTKTETYDGSDIFPSLNMAYRFNERHIARAAYGASVNRPEFREVSKSVYFDFDLFSDVKGNPDLKTAYIQNVDLRYEFYPTNGELISVTLFYKNFRNPIEWTYLDAGGSYTYTFENAKSADNYGVELELRKNLDFIGMPDFSLNVNAALISSKVSFSDSSLEKDRPMQGQSPYLINAGLYYQNQKHKLNMAAMYNRIGKRIIGVGRIDTSQGGSINNNIPDSYEMPRNSLDFSVSKKFGCVELRASVTDILAEKLQFMQLPEFIDENGNLQKRSQVTKSYNPGRTFNLTLSVNL